MWITLVARGFVASWNAHGWLVSDERVLFSGEARPGGERLPLDHEAVARSLALEEADEPCAVLLDHGVRAREHDGALAAEQRRGPEGVEEARKVERGRVPRRRTLDALALSLASERLEQPRDHARAKIFLGARDQHHADPVQRGRLLQELEGLHDPRASQRSTTVAIITTTLMVTSKSHSVTSTPMAA